MATKSASETGRGAIAPSSPRGDPDALRLDLANRFREVRCRSVWLADPLSPEDCQVQSMADASPIKWHLAHSAWFFETFLVVPSLGESAAFHPRFRYLFNSYYNAVGDRTPRSQRGLMSRPTLDEIKDYRRHVDARFRDLLDTIEDPDLFERLPVIELGLNHEQQHQELMLTDIKHAFGLNPMRPTYRPPLRPQTKGDASPLDWREFDGGIVEAGHEGAGFSFDNEGPRHRTLLEPFRLASRPVNCGEYLAFIDDRGYERPEFWLSEGWATVQNQGWKAPLYWELEGARWSVRTLTGARPIDPAEPVCHVSYYEADAFARWAGHRLPGEFEWESAAKARAISPEANLLEEGRFHPTAFVGRDSLASLFGDVWEWTRSAYLPYPGSKPTEGALGEYNGKFMCNQFVLRGGSCATPRSHLRATYRNFFPPDARWQFSGIRMASDA